MVLQLRLHHNLNKLFFSLNIIFFYTFCACACEEKPAEEVQRQNPCYVPGQDLDFVNNYVEEHKLLDMRFRNHSLADIEYEQLRFEFGIAYQSCNTPSSLYEDKVRDYVFSGQDLKHPQTISGSLHFPAGIREDQQVPAMILSPGGTSIDQIPKSRAKFINFLLERGYACLVIDHFTLRKINRTTDRELMPSDLACVRDAFEGLKLLSTCPFIDASKIGITGFSHGMLIAELASRLEYQQIMSPHHRFVAHFMFYPLIVSQEINPNITGPLYYFAGKDDDLTPPNITEHYVQYLKSKGHKAEIFIYGGADDNDKVRHGFNVPEFDGYLIDFMNWLYEKYCAWQDYPRVKKSITWIANRLAGLQDSPGFQEIENLKRACYLYDQNGFWPFPEDLTDLNNVYQSPGQQLPWSQFATVMSKRMSNGGHLKYHKAAYQESLNQYSTLLLLLKK